MKRLLLLSISMLVTTLIFAQSADLANDFVRQNAASLGLEPHEDITLKENARYTSSHNGVTHVFTTQTYLGVDIDQAGIDLHIKDGEIIRVNNYLIPNFAEKIASATTSVISPEDAVSAAFRDLGYELKAPLKEADRSRKGAYVFEKGNVSGQDIPANLVYTRISEGNYVLTWTATVEPKGDDIWDVRVDANTGEVVKKANLTLHCTFPHDFLGHHDGCSGVPAVAPDPAAGLTEALGGVYNVIPVPFESPIHGARQLVTGVEDPEASPFGWHDLDGVEGADTTITFGNNVHAMLDRDGNLDPDLPHTDGGEDLMFDFEFDQSLEPDQYADASVTNLFYMNNIMHDLAYAYGFDELAGNFQAVNYEGFGTGGDYVTAHAHYGAGTADPPLNNATFGTPNDGGNGRMRMYLWSGAGENRLLQVVEPQSIAGTIETSTTSGWGSPITDEPLTAEVVIVDDGSGSPTLGCRDIQNGDELEGKIALIDRGQCEFGEKAYNAQQAGAIGFIICNFQEGLVNMGGGDFGGLVDIPGVFISSSDCQRIRAFAGEGLTVTFVNETAGEGPFQRAGSFDNGVIAHEYAHGISNRLTGGPSRANCLFNYDSNGDGSSDEGEQMGEGWSDFFTLITSVKSSDTADKPRGIGTYADGQDTTGGGIRPFPYTSDMTVNPMTYDDVAFNTVPHGVGSVWCTMLWDLYWALSDKHGWDPDLYHGTGGNNLAIQLVMDGMKLQPCNPGFIDGRDAILLADTILTGGENGKLIWEVFARRGLGWSADQGSNQSRKDGSEAFDLPKSAVSAVQIEKNMSSFIEAGQEVEVSLVVANYTPDSHSGLVVRDMIPQGAALVAGSASMDVDVQGDVLTFELDELAVGDEVEITYTLSTSDQLFSTSLFYDDMENGGDEWVLEVSEGNIPWELRNDFANSGEFAWAIPNTSTPLDQSLINVNPIFLDAENPALRFFHYYETEKFSDAGIVQISTDFGFTWTSIPEDKVVRGSYSGKMDYGLFAIPNLRGWHGNSGGFVETVIDLSDYAGETVVMRWRFGANETIGAIGWFVDDIEFLDAHTYNSEACVLDGDNVLACAESGAWGTLVAAGEITSSSDPAAAGRVDIFPNPANSVINVRPMMANSEEITIELITGTGAIVFNQDIQALPGEIIPVPVKGLAEGMYFVRVITQTEQIVSKVVVSR